MSVSDLTNTTWVINNNPTITSGYGRFYVNISCNDIETGGTYSGLAIGYNYGKYHGGGNWANGSSAFLFDQFESSCINGYTLTFTGGTDVTNSTLISWLEANATLQDSGGGDTSPTTNKIGDLSIIKKHFGDLEVIKEVINGSVIYESVKTYTITSTITNGTYTGDTEITNTASVTISANTGYSLPSTISVSGATYTYDSSTGVVSLSSPTGNVTISATCVASYPVKSDIITMNVDGTNRRFRVLKNVSDSVFEVMCLYFYSSTAYYQQTNNTYANSGVDNYCNNTFYNALNNTTKSAIVDKTFRQEQWGIDSSTSIGAPYYTFNKNNTAKYCKLYSSTYGTSITRHCYTLSMKSLIDYFEATTNMTLNNTTLTSNNIIEMFDNLITENNLNVWLMDAGKQGTSTNNYCKVQKTSTGAEIFVSSISYSAQVIPVFQIDLSKISFTKN